MSDQETKNAILLLLSKANEKVQKFINSIRIPSLLSFFISKDGKINPTLEQSLNEAPPANQNWVRLALGKTVFGPIKVWMILALPIVIYVVKTGSDALIFFITILSQGIAVIPLLIVGYCIWKYWPKK